MGQETPYLVGSQALRISQDSQALLAATDLAHRMLGEGLAPERVSDALEDLLPDRAVADAIVAFVESEHASPHVHAHAESALGLYVAVLALMFIGAFYAAAHWLYGLVESSPRSLLAGVLAAFGQATLLRLSWRMLKMSGIGLTDSLNGATYPTVLHRPRLSTVSLDRLRRERLRFLIADMVVRLAQGDRFRDLFAELTRIELTRPAAVWLLMQAQLGLMIGVNFPPYHNRVRAYLVAGGAAVGCLLGIITLFQRAEASHAHLYFLSCWSVLFVAELLRRPHKSALPEGPKP